jgi:hypothetical protein
LEIGVGVSWIGGVNLGSANANETSPTLQPIAIFTTSTTFGGAPAIDGRVGWRVARTLTAEAEASAARPQLRIAVANDVEGAPAATIADRVEQFTIGGALRWRLPFGSERVAPFLAAGGGFLRQLHENATLAQSGRYYALGGGVAMRLSSRMNTRMSALGVRVDARAIVRARGVAFDDSPRAAPAAGASLFVRF